LGKAGRGILNKKIDMPHCNKQMISFFLTTRCNLRCVYCYNSKERADLEEQTLPLDIAKAGLDEYFAKNTSRHIRFYGPGEATQEFELMKQITEYTRQKAGNRKITAELQTNGAFDKEVREWVLGNVNILWVSYDGTPDIHNKQRPMVDENDMNKTVNSSNIIEENVKWLLKNKGNRNLMIGLRSTITNDSIYLQKEMIDHYKKLGIKYIWCDPEFPAVNKKPVCDDPEKLGKYNFDMNAYVEKYIEAYRYAKTKRLFYGSFLTCNFDSETIRNCRCCTPVPHITPDGYVSACDLVVLGKEAGHMKCFIYGKWDNESQKFVDFDKEKKALEDRNVHNMPHCQKCPVKLHCAGYCPGEVVNETGDLFGRLNKGKRNVCKAMNKLYNELYNEITEDLKDKGGLYPYPHP
jgi:radical SAM protein with 4Fe4S-binding SPASM domain